MLLNLVFLSSSLFLTQFPQPHIGYSWSLWKDPSQERIGWTQFGLTWSLKEYQTRDFGDLRLVALSEGRVGPKTAGLMGGLGLEQKYDLGPRHRKFFFAYGAYTGPVWMLRTKGYTAHMLGVAFRGHAGPLWMLGEREFAISFVGQFYLGFIHEAMAHWSKFEAGAASFGIQSSFRF
ncbi:MAG: hypothetical protein EA369_02475 [Bradymonadales bacterium]|nr:MAG: hypothetical protein EA369_02475 [Bradymonadales bacterium]